MKIIDAIAIRLEQLLKENQLTQYALCKKIAIDPSNIYNILYAMGNSFSPTTPSQGSSSLIILTLTINKPAEFGGFIYSATIGLKVNLN